MIGPTPPLAIYVHIPFCAAKCGYCDFASRPARPGEIARYLRALRHEISHCLERGRRAESFYLGGGTPSLLTPNEFEEVLAALRAAFAVAEDAEITVEANPGTMTVAKARRLRELGVNRVSLGVQSLDDGALLRLGRTHTAAEAIGAFEALRRAGWENIGLDLIHGLPGQAPSDWRRDLARAIALGPEHLSLYSLSIEPGTPFAEALEGGRLELPSEEEGLRMFADAGEMAAAAGYEHYEISNFARPGRRSRHNQTYWSLGEYRGFGAAAHSFQRRPSPVRSANARESSVYADRLLAGGSPEELREELTPRQLAGEALMLGLRTRDGVDAAAYAAEHGSEPGALFPEACAEGAARGWLEASTGRLRLTREGVLFSNRLFRMLF